MPRLSAVSASIEMPPGSKAAAKSPATTSEVKSPA
jgi:hypothetical protein